MEQGGVCRAAFDIRGFIETKCGFCFVEELRMNGVYKVANYSQRTISTG